MQNENKTYSPLLSVCLITYNHKNYIREAIEGVLMQKVNFTWELIIADDCSTDGTRDILLEYKNKYPEFIKLILQEKNKGASQNWKDLITTPKSKYIAYFEGDDYWTDCNKLQKQINFLEANADFAITFHKMMIIYENHSGKKLLSNKKQKEITDIHDLARRNYIFTASCVFRNQQYDFPEWFNQCAVGDYPLNLLNARFGKIKYFNDVMGVYRVHSGGIWENSSLQSKQLKWIDLLNILIGKFDKETNEILSEQRLILEIVNRKRTNFRIPLFLAKLFEKYSLQARWHALKTGLVEYFFYTKNGLKRFIKY